MAAGRVPVAYGQGIASRITCSTRPSAYQRVSICRASASSRRLESFALLAVKGVEVPGLVELGRGCEKQGRHCCPPPSPFHPFHHHAPTSIHPPIHLTSQRRAFPPLGTRALVRPGTAPPPLPRPTHTVRRPVQEMARALRQEGVYNAYIMRGGYAGWRSAGLPTSLSGDYSASAGDLLLDEAEVLSGRMGAALMRLRDPAVVAPIAGGTLLSAAIVLNYHTALKVIGLWGLGASLYGAITSGGLESGLRSAAAAAASKAAGGSAASKAAPPTMQVTTGAYKPPSAAAASEPAEAKSDA
eukprot:360951-Chlamydomonas_euryale.AAC.2